MCSHRMPHPLEAWALHPYLFDIGVPPPPQWVCQYSDAPKFGIKTKQENMSTGDSSKLFLFNYEDRQSVMS